jgi:fluoride ion exporter CrcB/FEX
MDAMQKLTMDNVVGFVLAILFALVMGISMWGLLVGDYVNTVMNEQTRHTLRIVGFAGALAALATWWVQNFAARRGFTIRFLFSMMIFAVAFAAFGGLLRFIYIHATYPSQQDWSLTGLYFASLNDFYTFLLDMFLPPRPAYAALTVAAAIFVAIFGPREAKTADI